MANDFQQQIDELNDRFDDQDTLNTEIKNENEELTRKVEEMDEGGKLNRNLDNQSKNIIESIISDRILDIAWSDFFHYITFFEPNDATNGWGMADSSGGSSAVSFQSVVLQTGTSIDDDSSIGKEPIYQDILTYEQEQRFKTAFQLASVTDVEFNVEIGVGGNGSVGTHYGFLVVNDEIKGACANGSTQSTVSLLTGISNSVSYLLEVRFYPGYKIDFYIKESTDNELKFKGSLTTNLPSGGFTKWARYNIRTKTTAAKIVNFSFFEYIQRKVRE